MAFIRSMVLRNYRRFRGEIELPFSGGIDIVQVPKGMGKSSIAEAAAWCLVGGMPDSEVMNAEGKEVGEDTLVALTFADAERTVLERSIGQTPGVGLNERTAVRPDGVFDHLREELFPAACIDSNIISGSTLGRVMQGERSGGERAVERMRGWSEGDALLRSSMEATSLYLAMVDEPSASCLLFDRRGRPAVQCDGTPIIGPAEHHAVVLASALAFARESCPGVPVILDEPFKGLAGNEAARASEAVAVFMEGRQLIVLLSDVAEIDALHATGKVGKELEIKG